MVGPDPGAIGGCRDDAARDPLEVRHPTALMDPDPALAGHAGEPSRQLGRVEQHVAPGRPVEPGLPDRRVDLGLDGLPVQELQMLPVAGGLIEPRSELVDLVGLVGQGQGAGLLEVAIDPVQASECDQAAEVVDPFLLEPFEFVREVADTVGEAVGQRGLAEPAIAPAGAEGDAVGLGDDNPKRWVRVGQGDRGP